MTFHPPRLQDIPLASCAQCGGALRTSHSGCQSREWAFMLGVRRVGVTEAATSLQRRNLIEYKRGQLAIVNGRELEAASCECYATAERVYRAYMN